MKINKKRLFKCSLVFFLAILLQTGCASEGLLAAKVSESGSNWQQQVNELDEKIVLLKRWQEGYRMTAEQAQFKADRLQFDQENLIDAKRLWKVAENATQKAQDLQVIINKLEEQRNGVLKKHNQPTPNS